MFKKIISSYKLKNVLKPRNIVATVFLLAICLVIGIIIHECGHIIATWICGGSIKSIILFGFQLYPEINLSDWHGIVARVAWDGVKSEWKHGFILFMGAGTTMIAAYMLLLIVSFLRNKQTWKVLFITVLSIGCAWDIITYSLLPIIGIPHRIIIGYYYTEPVEGMILMGIPKTVGVMIVVLHMFIYHFVLFEILLKEISAIKDIKADKSIQGTIAVNT